MSSIKYQPCRNGCGKMIYWGDLKSPDGKKSIPMEKGTKEGHNCPNSEWAMKNKSKELGTSVIGFVLEIKQSQKDYIEKSEKRITQLELSRWDFTTDDKIRALDEKLEKLIKTGIPIPTTSESVPAPTEQVLALTRHTQG